MAIKSPEVFISYKRGNQGHSLAVRIKALIEEEFGYKVIWDESGIDTGADIRAYMNRLAKGTNIIFVLTPEFLRSPYCMYELSATANERDFKSRVFAVLSQDLVLDRTAIMDTVDHWSSEWQQFKVRIESQRKANPKFVKPETLNELSVLESIAGGSSTALFSIADKRWLQADAGGNVDLDALRAFLRKWVKKDAPMAPPAPPIIIPWRKIGMGLLGMVLLAGLIWGGSKLFQGGGDKPVDPNREQIIRDSIYDDSVARATAAETLRKLQSDKQDAILAAHLRDSLKADSIAKAGKRGGKPSPKPIEVTEPTVVPPTDQPKTYSEIAFGLNTKMVHVPGGTFTMGCTSEQGSDCQDDERPAHSVTLSGYYIGSTEVTQRQWRAVMGKDPEELRFKGCDDCPVERVSWNDCQDFIKKLKDKTGLNYHLPTEAQWEYAARGGAQSRGTKFAGGSSLGSVGWYDGNSENKTHDAGKKAANELGLFDMSGNVYEWCSDWYNGEYYKTNSGSNPKGPGSGTSRVLRGGSWLNASVVCRVSLRGGFGPVYRYYVFGFRLARD